MKEAMLRCIERVLVEHSFVQLRASFRHVLRVGKRVELVRAMLRSRGARVLLVSRRVPASSASGVQILDWVL